jgi:arsenate reductase-like glutaredoxin family protein
MPAPLGRTPTKRMPSIEIFGADDSPATRAALRFFRERRIVPRYVDVRRRPLTRDELRWFAERLGAGELLAGGSPTAVGSGASPGGAGAPAAPADDAAVLARLRSDPRLLRVPLVRHGREATAGPAETTWRSWLARRQQGRGG